MSEEEVWTTPVLHTITEGIIVQRPEGQAAPPEMGEHGSVSVGRDRVFGVPVLCIALHHPDGETMIGTFDFDAVRKLTDRANQQIHLAWGPGAMAETKQ